MTCGIYRITNLKSGRIYIGSARNIEHRWRQHRTDLKRGVHANLRLQWAWRRDGPEAFRFEIIEVATLENLTSAEQRWFDATGCCKSEIGYNIQPTADGSIRAAETLAKIGASKQGEKHPFHRLTERDVQHIKARLIAGERSPLIAADHDVSAQTISDIKGNRTWTHVPWPETDMPPRMERGETHYNAILTEANVVEIKRRLCAGDTTHDLAKAYGVTHASVSDIKYGRTWKHVLWPMPYAPRKDGWLSVESVREIKRRIANGEVLKDIALDFNIHPSIVSSIKNGAKYKNIT